MPNSPNFSQGKVSVNARLPPFSPAVAAKSKFKANNLRSSVNNPALKVSAEMKLQILKADPQDRETVAECAEILEQMLQAVENGETEISLMDPKYM